MTQDNQMDIQSSHFLSELKNFVQEARLNTWLLGGHKVLSYRPGSRDLQFSKEDFTYLDSYFGSQDFFGQEVIYLNATPIWVMNYDSHILAPDRFDGTQAAIVTRQCRGELYQTNRFLQGLTKETELGTYVDESQGDIGSFRGREWIHREGIELYEFVYQGGFIRE